MSTPETAPGVTFSPLITAGDKVPQTSNPAGQYRMVGIPDGLGAYKDAAGQVHLFMNHEFQATQSSSPMVGAAPVQGAFVDEWILDGTTGGIISGDLAFNRVTTWDGTRQVDVTDLWLAPGSKNKFSRFCSGNLAGIEEGLDRLIYFCGEENGVTGSFDGRGAQAVAIFDGVAHILPQLSHFNKENLVVVPQTGDKTVILATEDLGTRDSQLYMYVGTKDPSASDPLVKNGLVGGKLYFLAGTPTGRTEAIIHKGDAPLTSLSWVEIPEPERKVELTSPAPGDLNLNAYVDSKNSFNFRRLEDIALDPWQAGTFYFVSTGGGAESPANPDSLGRVWKSTISPIDPTGGATLEVIVEGDRGDPTINGDNIDVNEYGQMVILEDPNSPEHGAEYLTARNRDGSAFLFDLTTREFARLGQYDRVGGAISNGTPDQAGEVGAWETSGVIDVSEFYGQGTWLWVVQADTLNNPSSVPENLLVGRLGGQLLLVHANRPPEFTFNATVSVPENTTFVATVTSVDNDLPTRAVTQALTGGADLAFFGMAPNGQVSFLTAPDFEKPLDANRDNVYEVQVTANDGVGGLSTQTILITVLPVNDQTPMLTSAIAVSVLENQRQVTQLTALDGDMPQQQVTFTLSGGADQTRFELTPSGILSFLNPPDYESPSDSNIDNVYEVQITLSDGAGGQSTHTILCTVMAVNDNLPIITSPASVFVPENQVFIAHLSATDADKPQQNLTFSITGGADQTRFELTAAGALSFIGATDFETPSDANTDNVYEVIVSANDGSGGQASQAISITVLPVNDNLPVFTSGESFVVSENQRIVGQVTAKDAEVPSQLVAFAITGGVDQALFELTKSGTLQFIVPPDFESPSDAGLNHVYEVVVTADDGSGGQASQAIFITVLPVNDNIPVFLSSSTFEVHENQQYIGQVVVSDVDLPTASLALSITGGADQGLFSLAADGTLRFDHSPDFEQPADSNSDNVYEVQVTVDDGQGGQVTQALFVTVAPINDNAPVFISLDRFEVLENQIQVGELLATDIDQPAQDVLFSLVGGADQSSFTLTEAGQLTFTSPVDFEFPTDTDGDRVFFAEVAARDEDGKSTTQLITVTVGNVVESSTIKLNSEPLLYSRDVGAIEIDPSAELIVDSSVQNFSRTRLSVSFQNRRVVRDELAVLSQPMLGNGVMVANRNILFDGRIIGTIGKGRPRSSLVIDFNADADANGVQAVLRRLSFATKDRKFRSHRIEVSLTGPEPIGTFSAVRVINVAR